MMIIELSPDLCEVCGAHCGDGYMRGGGKRWDLDISGNIEERGYYDSHLRPLFERVFNIHVNCKMFHSRNTYGFVIRDRETIKFMNSLGFPYGKKTLSLEVPSFILKSSNNEMIYKFLRGLFDTDGCIYFRSRNNGKSYSKFKQTHHYYPVIIYPTISLKFNNQIKELLKNIGLKFGEYHYSSKKENEHLRYVLTIHGKDNVEKFFNLVGSKNPVKLSRFLLWKKVGHCPSHTTYNQRIEMLKNTD